MKKIFRANHEFIALGRIGLLITGLVIADFLIFAVLLLCVLMLGSWKFPSYISSVKSYDQIKFYLLSAALGAVGLVLRIYFDSSLYGLLVFIPFAIYIQNWLYTRTDGLVGVKEYDEIIQNKEPE